MARKLLRAIFVCTFVAQMISRKDEEKNNHIIIPAYIPFCILRSAYNRET